MIAIFAHTGPDFQQAKSKLKKQLSKHGLDSDFQISHCDSRTDDRLHFLSLNLDRWILFLDSDCSLTSDACRKIRSITKFSQSGARDLAYTGCYQNESATTYLQRAHNLIANCWLQSSFNSSRSNFEFKNFILGGVFLIYTSCEKFSSIPLDVAPGWGAEDKILSKLLAKRGYQIQFSPELKVFHATKNSWEHFIRRAFYQGYNDPQRTTKLQEVKPKIRFWIAELGFQDLVFLPVIGLHFLLLALGRSFQRTHPANKLKP